MTVAGLDAVDRQHVRTRHVAVYTFDQPAVEWGKRATRGLLGGGEFGEADAVAAKTELRVER